MNRYCFLPVANRIMTWRTRKKISLMPHKAVAICILALALPCGTARATTDWGYKCKVINNSTKLDLDVWFNSGSGGHLDGAKGHLAVAGGPDGELKFETVRQWWTTEQHFNVQFGSPLDDWQVIVVTSCKEMAPPKMIDGNAYFGSCEGSYSIRWDTGAHKVVAHNVEGKITCLKE